MGAGPPPKLLCPACVNARLHERGRAVHNLNRACNALRVRVRALTTSAAARQGVHENGADILEGQRRQRRIEALRRRAEFLRKEEGLQPINIKRGPLGMACNGEVWGVFSWDLPLDLHVTLRPGIVSVQMQYAVP